MIQNQILKEFDIENRPPNAERIRKQILADINQVGGDAFEVEAKHHDDVDE